MSITQLRLIFLQILQQNLFHSSRETSYPILIFFQKQDKAELIVSQELLMDQQLTPAASQAIQALWKDPAIQEVYNYKHEYQVTEAIAL